jgi:hypothetical protein
MVTVYGLKQLKEARLMGFKIFPAVNKQIVVSRFVTPRILVGSRGISAERIASSFRSEEGSDTFLRNFDNLIQECTCLHCCQHHM